MSPTRTRNDLLDQQPEHHFDAGLQQERNALAWERTSFSIIVAGALLGRYAAKDGFLLPAAVGGIMVVLGVGILVWSGYHYADLHDALRDGITPAHPKATRIVGSVSIAGSLVALMIAARLVINEWTN